MAMMHLKDGLDLLGRLNAALGDIDELQEQIDELITERDDEIRDNHMLRGQLNRIASKLTTTTDFYHWLMEQDASSAVTYSPSRKRSEVEDKDDVALALAFIEAEGGR